ncbi:MAG: heterodisulfide reductase [Euryarchaeota archaeon]|nr:heterodisulfide reductase [Euryarchaeota archaeon]
MEKMEPNYREVSSELVKEIKQEPGGEYISRCYQCGTCSATCVVNPFRNDFNPRRIIRMAVLGVENVLDSVEPWYCAVCYLCTERCPREVKPAAVLMAIKNVAAKHGRVPVAFKTINENIARIGRLFEIDDFTNFMREDMGLPPIEPLDEEEISKLIEGTRFEKIMKGEES